MILALVVLLVLGVLPYAFQRQLIFPASKKQLVLESPHHHIEALTIAVNGKLLRGYLARPHGHQQAANGLLYFNGRRENPTSIFRVLEHMPNHEVLCFYQRGLGLGWAKPGEAQLVADACAVLDWWTQERALPLERITIGGRSLGSGIAVQVAAQRAIQRLVLISPHDRLISAIRVIVPGMPAWWLKDRFESIAHMPRVNCPCLLVIGDHDRTIPVAVSRALFAGWPGALDEHLVPGGNHRGLLKRGDVQRVVGEFVSGH
ncbi:MAG TPA: alpha/beta fold hydrolase [Burkholderiaceae bacterium]|jgi:hypothetical protein